ncbi:hypothetical protein HR060_10715 [Catenovulum sp. SM1970]|uniref:hypothetical protein n=1 Tax=Marinifaba aquimaris TaxID=2741323 RepID=UPI001573F547|nr:hypothetical protein [Marinifaba aquimaris]NTS77336.1 hypothetical protein [Marinifaba aquimaris]
MVNKKNAVGQIACPQCGSVAEIRRRINGQKLPFLVCKHCGQTQSKNSQVRQGWLDNMVGLGELGEYGQKVEQVQSVAPVIEPEPSTEPEQKTIKEWTPPEELTPETLEPEPESQTPPEKNEKSGGNGWLWGVGFSILSLVVLGKAKSN